MTTKRSNPLVDKAVALLKDLVRGYTEHHNAIEVEGTILGGQILLTLRVHNYDHRKVVGSQGSNIWALQTIFKAYSLAINHRVRLTLLEPRVGGSAETPYTPLPFVPQDNWNSKKLLNRLRAVLDATLGSPYSIDHQDLAETTNIAITPAIWQELFDRGEYPKALHTIFHAIGKGEGRLVMIDIAHAKPTPATV